MNRNGVLCYITPSNYLTSGDSYSLRELLLKESAIKEIIDYEESDKVFKSVTQAVATIITEKVRTRNNLFHYQKHKQSYSLSLEEILKDEKLFIKGLNLTISKIKSAKNIFQDYINGYQGEINVSNKKEFFSDKQTKNHLPLVRGNNIGLWSLATKPIEYCPTSVSNRNHHQLERIVFQEVSNAGLQRRLKGVILSNVLRGHTTNYIFPKSHKIPLKFILALFNSKLLNYYFKFYNQTNHIPIGEIKLIPIPPIESVNHLTFINLVDYILKLYQIGDENVINKFAPNTHLIQLFEEVIDALVFELYFEEDFKKAGIEFMKYAQRDFKSIEGKSEKEAMAIIEKAYQTLREKDNEIRNNLKLMDIKLADLIMPIKTAK